MRPFLMLRAVAWLKRLALAAESIDHTMKQDRTKSIRPKLAEVHTPSIEMRNELWEEEHGER